MRDLRGSTAVEYHYRSDVPALWPARAGVWLNAASTMLCSNRAIPLMADRTLGFPAAVDAERQSRLPGYYYEGNDPTATGPCLRSSRS